MLHYLFIGFLGDILVMKWLKTSVGLLCKVGEGRLHQLGSLEWNDFDIIFFSF